MIINSHFYNYIVLYTFINTFRERERCVQIPSDCVHFVLNLPNYCVEYLQFDLLKGHTDVCVITNFPQVLSKTQKKR